MEIHVFHDGWLTWGDHRVRCALGEAGVVIAKREGDGGTPMGRWPLRRVLYRPDREPRPATGLPVSPLSPVDGWCDDSGHVDYNRQVVLPHSGRCEELWRKDGLYDLVGVLGYNDDPPVPELGSAIFLHVASPGYTATEGCVAIGRDDLRRLLEECPEGALVCIHQDSEER